MSVCPVCGSDLEGNEAFCPYCSTALRDERTQQWGPPDFDETQQAGPDEDWAVALWGQPEEKTVVEERIPAPAVEETIALPTRTTRRSQWYQNRLVLALIALNVILFVGLILAILDTNETVVLPPATSVLPTAIPATPQPTNEIPEGERPVSPSPAAVTPAPTTASTPATPKTWIQVASLEGTGRKKGPLFELTGGEAKLIYTVQGDQFAGMAIYVVSEGESIDEQGGSPDVNHQGSGSDETRIVKPAGRYYLDVNSANATWSVRVEELR